MPAPFPRVFGPRFYWQVPADTLQIPEQQPKSEVQEAPGGPQQLQLLIPGIGRHWEVVPSGRRHGVGLHVVPCAQGSHGAGQWFGSQIRLPGHGWLVEHAMVVQPPGSGAAGSRQNPQPH
jgi:hypothetical protein